MMSKLLERTGNLQILKKVSITKHFRLVGNVDYAVSQLWGQKNKTECLKLNPSKHAKNVKDADKVKQYIAIGILIIGCLAPLL